MIAKKNKKSDKIFNLQISEEGLNAIISALECISRLGIGQFRYALEFLPQYNKLSWDERNEIEIYLKEKTKMLNYGIYHPEVSYFNKCFQIKKEIEKRIALERSDGVRDCVSKNFEGAIEEYNYLPRFLNENFDFIEDKKEFLIPTSKRKRLKKLMMDKKFNECWELVDKSVKFNGIKGSRTEISEDYTKVIIWEPYKLTSK